MSNFTLSLDIDSLKIKAQTIDTQGNIIFDVESTKTETACHKCGQLTNSPYAKALFCRKIANSFLDAIFAATSNLSKVL